MNGNRVEELVWQGLAFVLRLALVLGGLGFASVFTAECKKENDGE